MLHIVLCDDNELHLAQAMRVVEQEAAAHGEAIASTAFASAEALLSAMRGGNLHAEIAILDIAMDNMDGISLAKYINAVEPRCQIIFLTGYTSYVMDVYETNHVYYVLKEMLRERIWPAIERAYASYTAANTASFVAETATGMQVCRFSDICFFERCGRKTCVKTEQQTLYIKDSLNQLQARLPEKPFLRCHQSFLINLDWVAVLESDSFLLREGSRIPISRVHRKCARETFWSYINASI